jgi:predicted DCC family thiol-disulfide oxidoreductase YuxK
MTGPAARSPSSGAGRHLILFDGVCGLCSRLVQFVLAHDRRAAFRFASLQSAIGQATVTRSGGNPLDLNSFYLVADFGTPEARALTRSDAALFVVSELGWPWKAMQSARVIPKALRDRMYDLVARYRYRVFGRYDQCQLPDPQFRSRFVE